MKELLYGSVGELLGVVVYGVVASALAILGAVAEITASQNLLAGHTTIGVWEGVVGLVLLYAGYSVLTDFVLPELRGDGETV
jgi:hypothetical protein